MCVCAIVIAHQVNYTKANDEFACHPSFVLRKMHLEKNLFSRKHISFFYEIQIFYISMPVPQLGFALLHLKTFVTPKMWSLFYTLGNHFSWFNDLCWLLPDFKSLLTDSLITSLSSSSTSHSWKSRKRLCGSHTALLLEAAHGHNTVRLYYD